jgi:hypothetical protein
MAVDNYLVSTGVSSGAESGGAVGASAVRLDSGGRRDAVRWPAGWQAKLGASRGIAGWQAELDACCWLPPRLEPGSGARRVLPADATAHGMCCRLPPRLEPGSGRPRRAEEEGSGWARQTTGGSGRHRRTTAGRLSGRQ